MQCLLKDHFRPVIDEATVMKIIIFSVAGNLKYTFKLGFNISISKDSTILITFIFNLNCLILLVYIYTMSSIDVHRLWRQ